MVRSLAVAAGAGGRRPWGASGACLALLAMVIALPCAPSARAQGVVAVQADFDQPRVEVGDVVSFTVTISSPSLPRGLSLNPPDFSPFEVVGGPMTSHSTQVSFGLGRASQQEIQTFTWQLVPKRAGTLVVPPIAIVGGGVRQATPRAELVVLDSRTAGPSGGATAPPDAGQRQAQESQRQRAWAEARRPWEPQRTASSLRVKAVIDDGTVWVGQEILLSHVLEFAPGVPVRTFAPQAPPEFPGFSQVPRRTEEPKPRAVTDPSTGSLSQYEATLARWVLVPLSAGTKEIGPQAYSIGVQQAGRDLLSEFFRSDVVNVVRATAPISIQVRPLPEGAPASFSGAVGRDFKIAAGVAATSVRAGDGTTLTLTISGGGSVQGIGAPKLELPAGLKVFEPESRDDVGEDASGRSTGTKTFSYPLLVTAAGDNVVPSIAWSYFDVRSGRYVELTTTPITVRATPSDEVTTVASAGVTAPGPATIEVQADDIHHVRTGLGAWRPDLGAGQLPAWLWPALGLGPALSVLVAVGGLLVRLGRRDPDARRLARAEAQAKSRLRQARSHARDGRLVPAADAAARAVAGLVSDRLLLGAELSASEAAAAVAANGDAELGERVGRFLQECDFTRFASGAAQPSTPTSLVDDAERLVARLARLRPPTREPAQEVA